MFPEMFFDAFEEAERRCFVTQYSPKSISKLIGIPILEC
jgi:hypothetical protein